MSQELAAGAPLVLDLGCGTGRMSERLASSFDSYTGVVTDYRTASNPWTGVTKTETASVDPFTGRTVNRTAVSNPFNGRLSETIRTNPLTGEVSRTTKFQPPLLQNPLFPNNQFGR